MKLKFTTEKDGIRKFTVTIGKDDAEILESLVCLSLKHTPKVLATTQVKARMRSMARELKVMLGKKRLNPTINND